MEGPSGPRRQAIVVPRHTAPRPLALRSEQREEGGPYGHMLVALPVAADDIVPFAFQALGEVGGNEAAAAGDTDPELGLGPVRLERVLGELAALVVVLVDGLVRHGGSKGRRRRWGLGAASEWGF